MKELEKEKGVEEGEVQAAAEEEQGAEKKEKGAVGLLPTYIKGLMDKPDCNCDPQPATLRWPLSTLKNASLKSV